MKSFVAVLLLAAGSAFASSICPVMTAGNAGGGMGVSGSYISGSAVTNGGCNVLITFNADGSITTTFPNTATSYDGGNDDNLVGILNNTSLAINSIVLTGTGGPFSFELGSAGDGACDPTWTFQGGNPCGTATSGYAPEGVTFSDVSGDENTGTVNFSEGISGDGGSNWFSLEGPVDVNLQINNAVPEPGSMTLLALGLSGLYLIRRKFAA